MDEENQDRQALKLNRLEAYLLKLVIPSIRIAHCPRGPYLKLKGDLILISSDIGHSLSKILPVQQSIIPVCFKRKLSYTGSYIEEYVENDKVKMYFAWLKNHNHLYKDTKFDETLLDGFLDESISASIHFESSTRTYDQDLETEECVSEKDVEPDENDIIDHFRIDEHAPYQNIT